MARAGLSRAELDDAVLSEGGASRSRGGNGSGYARRIVDDIGTNDTFDDARGAGGVCEEQSSDYYDDHEVAQQWHRSVGYNGELDPHRRRAPPSGRRYLANDDRGMDRDCSPPPDGHHFEHRRSRGGGRGYRDDYYGGGGEDVGMVRGNSSQDYFETGAADDHPLRGGRHAGESVGTARATTGRAPLPGAYASMEDPNAKSQIKEQIQNELQEFERALRSGGSNGRRRGHGSRSDDSYQSEESIRQNSTNQRAYASSRRAGDNRTPHYHSRGGDDDTYYDEASVQSNSSLHRQTSRGNYSTSSDRRMNMEHGGSGRNIISRNIPRESDRHDRSDLSQRRGSGERFYYDCDPNDRGPPYDRNYGYQDYYERGGGEDYSIVGDRGGHTSSSLTRRELESRLSLSRGPDRGSGGVGGGGFRGGGPDSRSHIDHRRTHDDSNDGGGSYRYIGGGDNYHRRDRSPQDPYAQPYSRRHSESYEHQNHERADEHHRSHTPIDRYPPQHYHEQHPQHRQVELEISPGVWMSLRGADETWNAIMNGAYCPTKCLMCSLNLLCILDAEYVLCPECRVVGPIGDDEFGMRAEMLGSDIKPHGVGLGFKPDDLMRWQSEIARGIDPRNSSFFSNSNGY